MGQAFSEGFANKHKDTRILNMYDFQVTTSAWACRMKVPGCEENAMELFQKWMDTPNPDENNP